jgi:hypothetical protein
VARPRLEVADIFRDHGPAWRQANAGHVSVGQLKVMSAIESCRTAALGGHVARSLALRMMPVQEGRSRASADLYQRIVAAAHAAREAAGKDEPERRRDRFQRRWRHDGRGLLKVTGGGVRVLAAPARICAADEGQSSSFVRDQSARGYSITSPAQASSRPPMLRRPFRGCFLFPWRWSSQSSLIQKVLAASTRRTD